LYGVQDIYVNLIESLQKVCAFAIQDDYSYWAANGEAAEGGKLLLIDDADYETQHIFFDDNLSDNPAHSIIDIRDLITGEPVSYKRAINKFVVRVESDKAILENDYFIKKIEECEKRRTEEIENMEKGIMSEEEFIKSTKADEWAVLQQLSTNEYLSRTVLPVVYQGLREVDTSRPEDPVKDFAFFLLRNQQLVKMPGKKPELEEKKEEAKKEEVKKEEEKKVEPEKPAEVKQEVKKEEAKKEVAKVLETKKQEAKKEQKKK